MHLCSICRGLWPRLSPHYRRSARPSIDPIYDPDAGILGLRLRPAVGELAMSRGQGQSGVPLVCGLSIEGQVRTIRVLASPQ